MSFAVLLTVPSFAVIVAGVVATTPEVETEKVAEDCPEGIATEGDTPTADRLDFKVTVAPLGPADPFRVTVPVDDCPPFTVAGESDTLLSTAAVIVSVPVFVPAPDTVIFAVWSEDTAEVATEKVAELEPAGTLKLAGTVAEPDEDDRLRDSPFPPAFLVKVTFPVDEAPPATDAGVNATDEIV